MTTINATGRSLVKVRAASSKATAIPVPALAPLSNSLAASSADTSALRRTITAAIKSAGKANSLIQAAAVAALRHCEAYGDTCGVRWLVNEMPASYRRGILVQFFTMYSPVNIFADTKVKGTFRANLFEPGTKNYKPFNIAGAEANPWHQLAVKVKDRELAASLTDAAIFGGLFATLQSMRNAVKKDTRLNDNERAALNATADIALAALNKARKPMLAKAA